MPASEDPAEDRTPSAATRAYTDLVRRIDLRFVRPGDRLPAAAVLAREIGVSRPAVLQALQRMQDEGRVEVGAGRKGVVVLPHDRSRAHRRAAAAEKNWAELGALLEIIDPGIARELARHGMPAEDVAEARAALDAMHATGDPDDLLALHNRFHVVLARATRMRILDALGVMSRQILSGVHDLIDLDAGPGHALATEHEQLLNAILAGDASRASEIAAWHVEEARAAVVAAFGDLPLPDRRPRRPRRPHTRAGAG